MTTESTNRLDEQAQAAVSRSERIAGAAGVATIAAFFLFCIVESVTVGVGTLGQPKSGFWPLVVAVAGLGLSIWALLMPSTSFDVVPGGSLRSVVAASAALAMFPLAYYYLGLPITSFLLSMVLLKFIGKEGWVLSGVVSALLAGGSYYVFVVLLRVPM
jgi:hypothetical protein